MAGDTSNNVKSRRVSLNVQFLTPQRFASLPILGSSTSHQQQQQQEKLALRNPGLRSPEISLSSFPDPDSQDERARVAHALTSIKSFGARVLNLGKPKAASTGDELSISSSASSTRHGHNSGSGSPASSLRPDGFDELRSWSNDRANRRRRSFHIVNETPSANKRDSSEFGRARGHSRARTLQICCSRLHTPGAHSQENSADETESLCSPAKADGPDTQNVWVLVRQMTTLSTSSDEVLLPQLQQEDNMPELAEETLPVDSASFPKIVVADYEGSGTTTTVESITNTLNRLLTGSSHLDPRSPHPTHVFDGPQVETFDDATGSTDENEKDTRARRSFNRSLASLRARLTDIKQQNKL